MRWVYVWANGLEQRKNLIHSFGDAWNIVVCSSRIIDGFLGMVLLCESRIRDALLRLDW